MNRFVKMWEYTSNLFYVKPHIITSICNSFKPHFHNKELNIYAINLVAMLEPIVIAYWSNMINIKAWFIFIMAILHFPELQVLEIPHSSCQGWQTPSRMELDFPTKDCFVFPLATPFLLFSKLEKLTVRILVLHH